jgi:hypothetical protein
MFWRAFLLRLGIPLAQARAKGQALVDSISARAGLRAARCLSNLGEDSS